jgi:ABC-type microcin C transport system permease subunit YejE
MFLEFIFLCIGVFIGAIVGYYYGNRDRKEDEALSSASPQGGGGPVPEK